MHIYYLYIYECVHACVIYSYDDILRVNTYSYAHVYEYEYKSHRTTESA